MKIYFGHSSSFDYKEKLYKVIKKSYLYNRHNIILPHDQFEEAIDSSKEIQSCDLMIAECSYPSTGLGIELGWANQMKKPILFIYKKSIKPSSSLKIISNNFIEYSKSEEMINEIGYWIKTKMK